jgi:hypothetical protein
MRKPLIKSLKIPEKCLSSPNMPNLSLSQRACPVRDTGEIERVFPIGLNKNPLESPFTKGEIQLIQSFLRFSSDTNLACVFPRGT